MRCWSNARIYLGLTSEEFFDLTPRQYHALMARHRELEEHRELSFAVIAHTVATFAGKVLKDSARLSYGDFMPSQRGKAKTQKSERAEAVFSIAAFFDARAAAAEQKQRRSTGEQIA